MSAKKGHLADLQKELNRLDLDANPKEDISFKLKK